MKSWLANCRQEAANFLFWKQLLINILNLLSTSSSHDGAFVKRKRLTHSHRCLRLKCKTLGCSLLTLQENLDMEDQDSYQQETSNAAPLSAAEELRQSMFSFAPTADSGDSRGRGRGRGGRRGRGRRGRH